MRLRVDAGGGDAEEAKGAKRSENWNQSCGRVEKSAEAAAAAAAAGVAFTDSLNLIVALSCLWLLWVFLAFRAKTTHASEGLAHSQGTHHPYNLTWWK